MSIVIFLVIIGIITVAAALITASGYYTTQTKVNDPRRHLKPNSTNYNLSMYSREEIEKMTKQEAEDFIEEMRSGNLSSLSPRDFAVLQEKLDK